MLLIKGCPRCMRGDLITGSEEYGPIVTCLQCGYVSDWDSVRGLAAPPKAVRDAQGHGTIEAA